MASIGSLIIDLVAKTAGFETDLGRAAKTAEKRSKDIERSFSKLGSRITGALGGLAAAFSFSKIIQATSEAEQSLAQLEAAVKSTSGAAGFSAPQLAAMSSELQNVTTYADDAIQSMQAVLLTFTRISGPEFEAAQQAILDVATRLGTDLKSAALQVGKALNDPIKGATALARSGIQLSDAQKSLIKSLQDTGDIAGAQRIILKELEVQFGGSARAARDNFGGALTGLKNAFGDLLEAKGGLPEATQKINELSTLLADPKTKQAADSLLTGIISAGAALVPIIGEVVDGLRTLAGGATEVEKLETKLEFLTRQRDTAIPILFNFGYVDGESIVMGPDAIEKEIERIQQLIKEANNPLSSASTGPTRRRARPGLDQPVAPSEEFTKLAEKLNEQIALHGKVGEAAKLAYAIQSGALEGLSDAEEKQLLSLARRADAVAVSTEAQKKAAEEQKKAIDDQEQARESIESLVEGLRQQVATFEQGEAAVIRYRIEHGDLAETFGTAGAAVDPYKQEVIKLTEEMEALTEASKRQAEANQEWEAAVARGAAITESVRTPLESYQETLGELNDALDLGVISQETYSRALEKAQESLDEASNKWTVFKDQAARNTHDIIADTLVNGFDKGAKGILDSFANMITQLAAQAIAADIAGKLFGKSGGGEGGGWIDAAVSLFSGFGGGRATGGPVSAGTMYRINEREPEYFQPNVDGKVIPLSKMPAGGGSTSMVNNINVRGDVNRQSANQLAIEMSRRQRLALQRLG